MELSTTVCISLIASAVVVTDVLSLSTPAAAAAADLQKM
jgi:hypothetical protein